MSQQFACTACHSSAGALFELGCSCPRAYAHTACLLSVSLPTKWRKWRRWNACAECGQEYTGAMCKEIARVALKRAKNARPVATDAVLFAKMCLAYAHGLLGDTTTAARDLARCLVSMTELLGSRHHLTLNACSRLCETLLIERRLDEAETRARALYLVCVDDGSCELIHLARSTLARVLRGTGVPNKLAEAETLLRACHPTSSTMRCMVGLLYGQRRFFEAAEFAVRSLNLNAAEFGPTHEDTELDARMLRKIRSRIGTGDARCAACGARDPKPKQCAGCRSARYCDPACQRAHRAEHRTSCSPKSSLYTMTVDEAIRMLGTDLTGLK
jgi:hypothetical protein